MILSRSRGFVFVKTKKTAGTSVELSLRRYSDGPLDIITPVAPEDERLAAELGLPGPAGFSRARPVRTWTARDLARTVRDRRLPRERLFYNHMTAGELAGRLPDWRDLTSISVVRNPWDRAVSFLYWARHRSGNRALTMDEVLDRWDPASNWRSISVDDRVVVDHVCRFEDLVSDLADALQAVGVQFDGWLPRSKASTGRNGRSYRDVLEPHQAEQIAERCAVEIAAFGYSY